MGIGAALQQIGGGLMNWGMQRKDQKSQMQQQAAEAEKQQKLLLERQAALQRLQVPPEKIVQLYDEQLKKAVNVRSQWQINPEGTGGSWIETGRDVAVPESKPAFQKFRQGDEEISAFVDPVTGSVQEVGRGNAFAPSQRRPAAAGGSNGAGGGSRGPAPSGPTDPAASPAVPRPPAAAPKVPQQPAEIRQKLGLIDNALRNAKEYQKRVVGEDGEFRDFDARLDNTPGLLTSSIQDMLYVKSGASAPLEEVKKWEQIYGPGMMERDSTAAAKVGQLIADIEGLRSQYAPDPQQAAAGGPAPATPAPPAEAVAQVKSDPRTAAAFDEIIGPAAAARLLGQR